MLEQIKAYQRMMYAQWKYSILIILQWMDASGKDWAVRQIFSWINPLGCQVHGFVKPTKQEMGHDFLWRVHKRTPEAWMIHIFNRSHYEDILVPTVEWYGTKKQLAQRVKHINDFEQLLTENNTYILKCYLHLSKDEQKKRLEERLTIPRKFWKHNDNDWESRKKWDMYRETYHSIFADCNVVPWTIVPTDKNRWKVYCITKALIKTFEEMSLERPELETEKFIDSHLLKHNTDCKKD
jgi:PPK2 family polyphosphate:nucleotide phosphotransferase